MLTALSFLKERAATKRGIMPPFSSSRIQPTPDDGPVKRLPAHLHATNIVIILESLGVS